MSREALRQAVFDGIMDYYNMDESDDSDQAEASEITDVIMDHIDEITKQSDD